MKLGEVMIQALAHFFVETPPNLWFSKHFVWYPKMEKQTHFFFIEAVWIRPRAYFKGRSPTPQNRRL